MSGAHLSDITHKLEDENLSANIEAVLNNLQPIEREVRTTDGNFYLMQITPYRTSKDRINGTIITFVNITTRKAAEEEIRFQAQLLNTVEQSVIATDLDGIVTYWNRFAEQLFGWMTNEAVGRNIVELTTPEIMAEQSAEIMSQLRQGKSWTGDFYVRRKDGAVFPARVHDSPVLDESGNLIGIVGISSDITEQKRREMNLTFLADFSQEMIRLSETSEIVRTFGEKISSLTDAAVCAFFEINEKKDEAEIIAEWHQSGNFSLSGKFSIPELVSDKFQKAMAGRKNNRRPRY